MNFATKREKAERPASGSSHVLDTLAFFASLFFLSLPSSPFPVPPFFFWLCSGLIPTLLSLLVPVA